jgi:hypothetical protein
MGIELPAGEPPEAEYCRAIETYLCRKNDGHLIRIVGPSFERVCAWRARDIPLRVVQRGIDRYFERYYAKGPKRRPVRIEFCEADVLDTFDEWRRAVGVPLVVPADSEADGSVARTSLPSHLERSIARLTALRAGPAALPGELLDDAIRELDAARPSAKALRGSARTRLLERLEALDALLLAAARRQLGAAALEELRREAEEELAPFKARLPIEGFERSVGSCQDRLVRERCKLPQLALP